MVSGMFRACMTQTFPRATCKVRSHRSPPRAPCHDPGSREAARAREVISDIASTPLDPGKPLWENWFLEGFEGTRIASVLTISHARAKAA
jgi:diacylglycerol O-acyltransferase